jgi:hypothetical protein
MSRGVMPNRIGPFWPWVTRRRYENLKQENYRLRGELHECEARNGRDRKGGLWPLQSGNAPRTPSAPSDTPAGKGETG